MAAGDSQHERGARAYTKLFRETGYVLEIPGFSMARVRTFRELPLLLRAVTLVCAVRLALWIVPFAKLRRVVAGLTHPGSRALRRYSADQLGWAVRTVSRHVPRATCLVQALGLYVLLRREGFESRIQIEVTKDAGRFEAHAWVESQDRVVIETRACSATRP